MTRPRPWRTHRGAWAAYVLMALAMAAMFVLLRDWPI